MKFKLFSILLFFLSFTISGQTGFEFKSNKKKITLPFQFINNLIIIPIEVNGVTLNFMIDTGVEETILFSIDDTEEVSFSKVEKVKIRGFGTNNAFEAYKSENNNLKIKNYVDKNHTIYLVLDQEINISSQVGIPVNGIIGNKFFKDNLIKIDYTAKKIVIYNPNLNQLKEVTKNYSSFSIKLLQGKPYIDANSFFTIDKPVLKSMLLIDTGNTDAFWFFKQKDKNIEIPNKHIDDFLGRGFSGDIFGKRGRIPSIALGDFNFKNPIVAFPDSIATSDVEKIEGRLGSMGTEVMRRFTAVYDYANGFIYLKKNNDYNDLFNFNMSGIEVQHQGLQWIPESFEDNPVVSNNLFDSNGDKIVNNLKYKFKLKPVYIISNVRKDSPAALAGLKKEDVILKINNQDSYNFSLEKINTLLKSEEGKIIQFEINRSGKILNFKIQLKNIL